MVKLRMTTVDVAAEVRCLRKLIGMRCANIYDLSPKTYVIKFARSSGVAESGESEKALLLLESGVRLHTTQFSRDKSTTPSGFTLKLRKHLRTRRLESVRQLGVDRIVDFQFGLGETAHHVILELYAQGNLLLTDSEYDILQLLRSWKDEEKGLSRVARERYPVESCRLLERTTVEKLDFLFKERKGIQADDRSNSEQTGDRTQDGRKEKTRWGKEGEGKGSNGTKKGTAGGTTLKSVLGEGLGYGPVLVEHIILDAHLPPDRKIAREDKSSDMTEMEFVSLVAAINRFEDWLESVVGGELVPEGYIFMQKPGSEKKESFRAEVKSEDDKVQIYDEFYPLVLKQLEERDYVMFKTFDAAMDEFFSKVEGQRAQQQRKAQEDSALSKLEKIRVDQTNRVKALKLEVDQSVRMAELIEYNLDDVDAGILAVRAALASGMDWKDLGRMIKEEKKAGNPVAGLIHSLQLETNQITLLLSNNLDDMDEMEKTQPADKVEVDLSLSAHANARRWFETKKKHATKQEKTVAAHEKAFKAAEKRTQQQLAQAKTVAAITHLRKVHWFEKFNWFISSENFLIISGRDAQQNELIVKRYMKKGDLYVHADLHGASSTIIKNHDLTHSIPPLTINQAGCFTVCRSQAWDSKIVTSAWWVEAHQVSKTAPTGEYLTIGSFMVRGKKNFLPPNPLVMGFGFLFRLDDSSIAAHLNERQVRGEGEESDNESSTVVDVGGLDIFDPPLPVESSDSDPTSQDHDIDGVSTTSPFSVGHAVKDQDPATNLESEASVVNDATASIKTTLTSELDELLDRALQLRSSAKTGDQTSKYAFEDQRVDDVESYDLIQKQLNVSRSVKREKPYVTKAERRKLKRRDQQIVDILGKDNAGNIIPENESVIRTELLHTQDSSLDTEGTNCKGQDFVGNKLGRGRRGKLKRIKEKYAEQDDEERQLRMALLASAGRKELTVISENEKDNKGISRITTKEIDLRRELELELKVCYKCKNAGHIARDCPIDASYPSKERAAGATDAGITGKGQFRGDDDDSMVQCRQELASSGETPKAKEVLSRRAYTKAAKGEIAAIMAEENIMEVGDSEKDKLTELDSLTGKPHLSDVLLYAVPVCGPYSALQGYKYRVKLTPGNAKKGKTAKVAVDIFTHMQEVTLREKELMKAVTDSELVACMIGNSKVTAPGLTKLKQTQKKSKKQNVQVKMSI